MGTPILSQKHPNFGAAEPTMYCTGSRRARRCTQAPNVSLQASGAPLRSQASSIQRTELRASSSSRPGGSMGIWYETHGKDEILWFSDSFLGETIETGEYGITMYKL